MVTSYSMREVMYPEDGWCEDCGEYCVVTVFGRDGFIEINPTDDRCPMCNGKMSLKPKPEDSHASIGTTDTQPVKSDVSDGKQGARNK